MIRIQIKPLSVNEAWQGERFKTPKYKQYEKDLLFLLPKIILPEPPYKVTYKFGFSHSLSDWDNPVKPLQDVLQKKYSFNDRDIFEAVVRKVKTDKGCEFFEFNIEHLEFL